VERCEFLVCRSIGKKTVQGPKNKSKNSPKKSPEGLDKKLAIKLGQGKGQSIPLHLTPRHLGSSGSVHPVAATWRSMKGGASLHAWLPSPNCWLPSGI